MDPQCEDQRPKKCCSIRRSKEMAKSYTWRVIAVLAVLSLVLGACAQPTAAPTTAPGTDPGTTVEPTAPTSSGGLQLPQPREGMFNVAFVYIGPHDDGGWSQAHDEGRAFVQQNVQGVHTAYVENIPEGAESEQVFRSLSRAGFDLIFGTSFGFMEPMEAVSEEFPDVTYIHISGYKSNMRNFGNLFGAMENMKYLGGMLAGARAKQDGNPKLGYMATFPIPEELRLGNAIALGMKRTCPECTMDVRWIYTWHDPIIEKEAAASLFDAGAQVVFTGADTPAVADVAAEKGKWGVTYDWVGSCRIDACLTVPYWNWGPVYAEIASGVMDGTYQPGWHYFDADTGALGLLGFMAGDELPVGLRDLDPEVIAEVQSIMDQMLAGTFDRFDVFAGPINDNQGNVVVPAGEKMEQADMDQFPPGAPGLECKYCMYWWAEGITSELPSTDN
jgi:basic membrane protein A and related proteins